MSGLEKGRTGGGGHFAHWVLSADGAGLAYTAISAGDRTVHVFGDYGTGTVTIQGTNDPDAGNWATLHDITGADAIFAAAGGSVVAMLAENTRFIRPSLASSTNPDLNVNLLSRGGRV